MYYSLMGKMRLSFIDSDLLNREIEVPFKAGFIKATFSDFLEWSLYTGLTVCINR
jgi:hypothetical protein